MTATDLAPMPIGNCRECGKPYYQTRSDKAFCCEKCRKDWNERRISGGMRLYDLAMRWRIERPKGALGELTQIADQLAGEERSRRRQRAATVKSYQEKDGT